MVVQVQEERRAGGLRGGQEPQQNGHLHQAKRRGHIFPGPTATQAVATATRGRPFPSWEAGENSHTREGKKATWHATDAFLGRGTE